MRELILRSLMYLRGSSVIQQVMLLPHSSIDLGQPKPQVLLKWSLHIFPVTTQIFPGCCDFLMYAKDVLAVVSDLQNAPSGSECQEIGHGEEVGS